MNTMGVRTRNPSQPCAVLKELLPAGVVTAELAGEGDPALLLAGERHLLGRAAPKRVREFAAGRLCARRAVSQFGFVDFPIGVGDDRRPRWPRLLTGSITHTDGFSAAAVGGRDLFKAIGIDVEGIGRVSSDIRSQVLLQEEADWLESLPLSDQARVATLMFSAKEAFYKCQYEVTGRWLEFKDVIVKLFDWNLDRGSFAVRPLSGLNLFERGVGPASGRFAVTGELVLTAMAIAAH